MSKATEASDPPPQYTQNPSETTHLSQAPPAATGSIPNEPPPQYEGPKPGMYPGYQSTYPPQGPYPAAVPTTTQPVVLLHNRSLGAYPCTTQCIYCHATITSGVTYEPGTLTWVVAAVLCFMGCWLGCCLIPFCINECSDVIHHCPNCHQKIGVFRRLS